MKWIILIVLFLFADDSISQSIRGRVLDTETRKPLSKANLYLVRPENTDDTTDIYYFGRYKFKIIAQTKTNDLGKYSFNSLTSGTYILVADFPMPLSEKWGGYSPRQDIDSNIIIKTMKTYYKDFGLLVTCPYDKTKNQLYCPICKKSDRVLLIEYGLSVPIYDSLGNLSSSLVETYSGGCIMDLYCNPTKHCTRCDKNL